MSRIFFVLLFLLQTSFVLSKKRAYPDDVLQSVLDQIDAVRIGSFIKEMTTLPRNTQSEWIGKKEDSLRQMFGDLGFKVVTKKYKVLECFPKDVNPSLTEVIADDGTVLETYREDGNAAEKILPAYNAWSKSGTVEGEPVYVNYGRKEDFEALKVLGIKLKDTIGIARYGKLYRGDKAKFAKEFGLAGLIIYMDSADYNPDDVAAMPDGPGLPDSGIQRGTLKDGFGDPSTYLYPSTQYAHHESKDVYEKRLPGITVMPINFENALPLLMSLGGSEVEEAWQGGKTDTPKYTYGPGFKAGSGKKSLKITVNLEYRMVEVQNIFGIVKGKQEPDRWVMIGNHRDTWVHGAVDATTGLASLHEIANGLSKHIKQGWRPRRTIVFASWGAEEQGIIGSVEFVEDYISLLQEKLVAYINVDVAASAQENFAPGATPNFRGLLEAATMQVKAPLSDKYTTFYDQWLNVSATQNGEDTAVLKALGSGSDYAGFIHMAGVSSIDLTIVGPYYTYHTEYDNYDYLSKYADPGFKGTKAVAEVAAIILWRMATDKIVPLDASQYSKVVSDAISGASDLKTALDAQLIDLDILTTAIAKFVKVADEYEARKADFDDSKRHLEIRAFNDKMLQMERSFIYPPGLPGRPQNRHVLFAPSILDSYSGSVFPGIFDCVAIAKASAKEEDWNEVRKQITIAAWLTRAASRALDSSIFPHYEL